MSAKKDQIIDKVKKLKAHAQSAESMGSVEEAVAFAARVTELMHKYQLSEEDVKEEEKDPLAGYGFGESITLSDTMVNPQWRAFLLIALAEGSGCKAVEICGPHLTGRTIQVLGRMEVVESVGWLYHFLSGQLLNMAQDHFRQGSRIHSRQHHMEGFLNGAVTGIRTNLKRQQEEQRQAASAAQTSIMLFNDQALEEVSRREGVFKEETVSMDEVDYSQSDLLTGYLQGVEMDLNANRRLHD